MMTASATTEEQQLSSSPSPSPHPSPHLPNLLPLPSTPLLSGRRRQSLSPGGGGTQSSLQESRGKSVMGSREIAEAALASPETGSVNS